MIEMIDWNDNAKAAVECFAEWARSMSKCGNAVDVDFFLKEFTDKAQPKTVADAVECCYHEWVSAENEYVKGASICTKCKAIAETATIEQEGEKWTHDFYGEKCRVLIP